MLHILTMNPELFIFYDHEWILYQKNAYEFDWLNEDCNSKTNNMDQLGVWWNSSGIIEYFIKPPKSSTMPLFRHSFDNTDLKLRCSPSRNITEKLHLIVDYRKLPIVVDTYEHITERNYMIVLMPLEAKEYSSTKNHLFTEFNKHLQKKNKSYNGDIARAMEDFCKNTDATYFTKLIDTFVKNCVKQYSKTKCSSTGLL